MNMRNPNEMRALATVNDPRRAAVEGPRCVEADDSFFYSVRTTGVYCRPFLAGHAKPGLRT